MHGAPECLKFVQLWPTFSMNPIRSLRLSDARIVVSRQIQALKEGLPASLFDFSSLNI